MYLLASLRTSSGYWWVYWCRCCEETESRTLRSTHCRHSALRWFYRSLLFLPWCTAFLEVFAFVFTEYSEFVEPCKFQYSTAHRTLLCHLHNIPSVTVSVTVVRSSFVVALKAISYTAHWDSLMVVLLWALLPTVLFGSMPEEKSSWNSTEPMGFLIIPFYHYLKIKIKTCGWVWTMVLTVLI